MNETNDLDDNNSTAVNLTSEGNEDISASILESDAGSNPDESNSSEDSTLIQFGDSAPTSLFVTNSLARLLAVYRLIIQPYQIGIQPMEANYNQADRIDEWIVNDFTLTFSDTVTIVDTQQLLVVTIPSGEQPTLVNHEMDDIHELGYPEMPIVAAANEDTMSNISVPHTTEAVHTEVDAGTDDRLIDDGAQSSSNFDNIQIILQPTAQQSSLSLNQTPLSTQDNTQEPVDSRTTEITLSLDNQLHAPTGPTLNSPTSETSPSNHQPITGHEKFVSPLFNSSSNHSPPTSL